jgi:hypothetical protein
MPDQRITIGSIVIRYAGTECVYYDLRPYVLFKHQLESIRVDMVAGDC